MLRHNVPYASDYNGFEENSCKVYLEALFKDKIRHQENKGDNVTLLVNVNKTDIENIKSLLPDDVKIAQQQAESSGVIFQISVNKESLMKFFIDIMKDLFDSTQKAIGQKAELAPHPHHKQFAYYYGNIREGIYLEFTGSKELQQAFKSLYEDFGMLSVRPSHGRAMLLNISDVTIFISAQTVQAKLTPILLDSLPKFSRDLVGVVCSFVPVFSMFNRSKDTTLVVSSSEPESSKKPKVG